MSSQTLNKSTSARNELPNASQLAEDLLNISNPTFNSIAQAYLSEGQNTIKMEKITDFCDDLSKASGNFNLAPLVRYIKNTCEDNQIPLTSFIDIATKWFVKYKAKEANLSHDDLLKPLKIENPITLNVPIPEKCPVKTPNSDLLITTLRESIKQYETLMKLQQENGQDITNTSKIVSMLKDQLESFKNPQNTVPIQKITLSNRQKSPGSIEKREKGLAEIFEFYCKQQRLIGTKPTFDDLSCALKNLTIGEFANFCKDFNIPISLMKAKEVYNKKVGPLKKLDWKSFRVFFFAKKLLRKY